MARALKAANVEGGFLANAGAVIHVQTRQARTQSGGERGGATFFSHPFC